MNSVQYVLVFQASPVHRVTPEVLPGPLDLDNQGLQNVRSVPCHLCLLCVPALPADLARRCNQFCPDSRNHLSLPGILALQVGLWALGDLDIPATSCSTLF